MCSMCDESRDGYVTCQDCGRMICFDEKGQDDISAPAYVTESGDLFCASCGRRYDLQAEEDADAEWGWMWEHYPADLIYGDADFQG